MGLAWYGGRTPGVGKVVRRMDEALTAADAVIEQAGGDLVTLSSVVPTLGGSSEHAVVLNEGSLAGLVLQRDTVRLVQREVSLALAQQEAAGDDPDPRLRPAIDVKLLRAGNEAARMLTHLAVRVAEGAFKREQGSELVQLLEALKAAQGKRD